MFVRMLALARDSVCDCFWQRLIAICIYTFILGYLVTGTISLSSHGAVCVGLAITNDTLILLAWCKSHVIRALRNPFIVDGGMKHPLHLYIYV